MKTKSILAILVVVISFGVVLNAPFTRDMLKYDDDGVIIVDGDNVESVIELHRGNVLIELYAPWWQSQKLKSYNMIVFSGHCKKLAPEFAKAAKRLAREDDPPFALIKGDAASDKRLGQKFNIKGYPALFFFKQYQKYKYNGPRTEEGIVNWVNQRLHPFLAVLQCSDLDQIHTQKEVSLVYFGDTNQTDSFAKVMGVAAFRDTTYDLYRYYQVIGDKACAEKYGVQDYPGFAVVRNFDPRVRVYETGKPHEFLDVIDWVHKMAIPEVIELRGEYAHFLFGQGSASQIVLVRDNQEQTGEIEKWLLQLKDKYQNKLLFAKSYTQGSEVQQRLLEVYGIKIGQDKIPTIRFMDKNKRKYKYEGDVKDLTYEKLDQLIQDFIDNKLQPYYKSEPLPSDQNELIDNLFHKVVGLNFDEQVTQSPQDMLVFYTRQNCESCIKVQTALKQVAVLQEIKDANVKFVIMDDNLNDHKGRNGQGSPQLRMYRASNAGNSEKEYADYKVSGIKIEQLKEWILKNTANGLQENEDKKKNETKVTSEEL